MKRHIILGVTACLIAATSPFARAVAGPQFLVYEGRNAVHEGQGGERKTVGRIDFWSNGEPPRKFRVLGSLTDRRHETGLYGMIRMSAFDSDIAKAALAAGGDAVVLQSEDSDTIGAVGFADTSFSGYGGGGWFNGSGSTFGISRQIRKHDARYIVVQYLPDDTPIPPSGAAAIQQPGAPIYQPRLVPLGEPENGARTRF